MGRSLFTRSINKFSHHINSKANHRDDPIKVDEKDITVQDKSFKSSKTQFILSLYGISSTQQISSILMRQVKNLAALGELVATVVMDTWQEQAFCHHLVTAPSQSFFFSNNGLSNRYPVPSTTAAPWKNQGHCSLAPKFTVQLKQPIGRVDYLPYPPMAGPAAALIGQGKRVTSALAPSAYNEQRRCNNFITTA